jgi:protein SCO1/2
MKRLYQAISLFVLALLLAACSKTDAPQQKFSSVDITGAPWGKDFHLTDHHGQARSVADFKGKAVVLFFGYTNCPDMCPMTMYKLATAVKKLGKDAERVQVLFVTLDPKRDTPEVLKQYVPAFHPTFLGMIGDEQTIDQTTKEFKVFYKHQKPDASGFYTVDHMGPAFVFDPQGRLRLFISDQHSADMVAEDLRTLLKGQG